LSRVGNFTEIEAKFFSTQLILAISHLHKAGICLGVFEPWNIFLDKEGYAKLTDFRLPESELNFA